MNKTIYKWPLKVTDRQTISMPKGAEILTVQNQYGEPMIWALVDPNESTENRVIEIFGTGNAIGYDMGVERKYISTFQQFEGRLVWHVFELL